MLDGFYHQEDVTGLAAPRVAQAMTLAGILRESMTRPRHDYTALLLIDPQNDFVQPDGALAVPGAVEDTHRTIEMIYRDAGYIDQIFVSLDTHLPQQIFFASWWQDAEGNEPAPFTVITAADVRGGRWRTRATGSGAAGPVAMSLAYVEELEAGGRNQLIIWPYHCLQGSTGQAVVPALSEAIAFWSAVHEENPTYIVKGLNPKTENYSVFEPEVERGEAINAELLDELFSFNRIYVAGQAKSHCVLSSLESMVRYFAGNYSRFYAGGKIHVLTDCMSSVQSPVTNFEAMANHKLVAMSHNNALVLTTTPHFIH